MMGASVHGSAKLVASGNVAEMASWPVRMFLTTTACCVVLTGSLIWVAQIIYINKRKKLQGLPQYRQHFPFQFHWTLLRACTPPSSQVAFSTMLFAAMQGFHAIFQRFGRHVTIAGFTPLVALYKAEYVEEVLSSNKILTKGKGYELLHSWLGTGLLTSVGEKWHTRRRLFTPAFHFRILDDFMSTINAQSFILAKKLGELSRANRKFDILPVVTMCTLDTICETVMGTTIYAQSDESNPYVSAVTR